MTPEKAEQHTGVGNADSADLSRQGGSTRQTAAVECGQIPDAVSENEVRAALRTMRIGSTAGPDRLSVQDLKRKVGERPGFLTGVYTTG